MNKTLKWLLGLVIICTLLYFGIKFFAVSWLSYFSNPPRIESMGDENLIEKIKKDYHLQEVERTPAFEREVKKDTVTYALYLYSKDFCEIKEDSIYGKSKNIAREINKLKLDSRFYKYKIVFCCKLYNPSGISFQYLRKEVNKPEF
ncbi:hypothetical protein JI747_010370 [Chryseobacterium sp. RG1]|uniref:Lipoprotein n=1 Tax=Chryseobacterium tagetis TaxID=2801334 RepID=A0ABS8A2L4_9FLAO|nr:hypothetical protein [Chryseobacterium tagetis]MCA6067583.1 hypothetical protein [Chryseobacterium tagetis]